MMARKNMVPRSLRECIGVGDVVQVPIPSKGHQLLHAIVERDVAGVGISVESTFDDCCVGDK
jgi:hypothetical protein